MNLTEIENLFRKSGLIKNELNFLRYIKLIDFYQKLKLQKLKENKFMYEGHHILPKKIWKEYESDSWNIVILPARYHLLAHRLLYKCIKHSSCVYAFNQMRRVALKNGGKVTGKIYEMVKIEFSELIGKNNTGRKNTEEQNKKISDVCSGTNVYRNKTTKELKRFAVGEEPLGWEPFQLGRVRTQKSKNKLGIQMKGRIWQYNPETKDVKFFQTLLPGYTIGVPPWFDNGAYILSTYKWAYSEATGEVIRCNESDIPIGFTLGRKYDNIGFKMINNSNYIKVLDLETKTYILVDKNILPNPRYIKHGAKISDIFVITYKNKKFYSWSDVEKAFPELPKYCGPRNQKILDFVIPKKHFNQTKERQDFCMFHCGKTFKNIGFDMYKLLED